MSEKFHYRVDSAQKFDSAYYTVEETDEGYLKVTSPVARVGVYTYATVDGNTVRELVTEETLASYESNATLSLKPVTNGHPKDLITVDNAKELSVGSVGESVFYEYEDKVLSVRFIITDAKTIEDVKSGKVELSPAYETLLVEKSGVFDGFEYDMIQTHRRYNHLAIVDSARGGSSLKIKFDGNCIEAGTRLDAELKKGEKAMTKIKVDSVDVEVSSEVAKHFDSLTAQIDSLNAKLDAKKSEMEEKEKELKKEKEKSDGIDALVEKQVKARVDGVTLLTSVLTDSEDDKAIAGKMDSMSVLDMQKAFIVAVQPTAKLDGKSDDYIVARVDACKELADANKGVNKDDNAGVDTSALPKYKNDGKETKKDARAEMIARDSKLWEKGE